MTLKGDSKRKLVRELLAKGHTAAECSKIALVSESTISAWRRDPKFAAKLDKIHDDRLDAASTRIKSLIEKVGDVWTRTLEPGADISAKDQAIVAAQVFDRAMMLVEKRRKTAEPSQSAQGLADGLEALFESRPELFAGIVEKVKKDGE